MKNKPNNLMPLKTKRGPRFKNFAAFTLAEILLSLTVIGIVAAIALPSLLGNANERAWETQKKALYTRFSQALPLLPSLNGYGELKGNLSTCQSTNSCFNDDELVDTAAESFIRDGLSKVIKITNICNNDHLSDCDLPDKIISINGNTTLNLSDIITIKKYNDRLIKTSDGYSLAGSNLPDYEQLDTKAAAFETVNGESILVYYNPNCEPDLKINGKYYTQPKMCANFIYDLNGKKGPNTVGKDIGIITALFSTDPVVVAPDPRPNNASTSNEKYNDAKKLCRTQDSRLPNQYEAISFFYNYKLFNLNLEYWSSDSCTSQNTGRSGFLNQKIIDGTLRCDSKTKEYRVRCVKR